eukprot:scaffold8732_cov133-Isochrysis_galbana.AAC.2
MNSRDSRVRRLDIGKADEAEALAPSRFFVHGDVSPGDGAVARELTPQVLGVERVVLATPHLAHHE